MGEQAAQSDIFSLRPANEGDFAFCDELVFTTTRGTYDDLHGPHNDAFHRNHFANTWPDLLPHTRIIERDDRPIGQLVTFDEGRRVFVKDLELMPAWQCKGIGAAVLRSAIDEAAPLPVELKCMPNNPHAQRFYERLNFRIVETAPDYLLMRHTQAPGCSEANPGDRLPEPPALPPQSDD